MNSKIGSGRNQPLKVLETPFCGDLRSKKYYMSDVILTDAEEYEDASGHTWCYNTQLPLGPDGARAAPEFCVPGRHCYRSALAEPVPYFVMLKEKNERLERQKNNENPEV